MRRLICAFLEMFLESCVLMSFSACVAEEFVLVLSGSGEEAKSNHGVAGGMQTHVIVGS